MTRERHACTWSGIRSLLLGSLAAVAMTLPSCSNSAAEDPRALSAEVCTADLDADGSIDYALQVYSGEQVEVIALFKRGGGYEAAVVWRPPPGGRLDLSCEAGDDIVETTAAGLPGRKYKTRGGYLKLSEPEGASHAFYWEEGRFRDVLLSD